MIVLIFLGPPGSGKGTQSKIICEAHNLEHLSMGDMLRVAVRNQTAVGARAQEYMKAGKLVPDEVILGVVSECMASEQSEKKGFVFDGFPRTLVQADALATLLDGMSARISAVLHMEIASDLLVRRLSGRLISYKEGNEYHKEFNPPRVAGICDIDGSELFQREDDQPEKIQNRLKVYAKETSPLLDYYKERGILHTVNAGLGFSEVTDELNKTIVALV